MTTNEFFTQIEILRKMVFEAIGRERERGEPGKSYEGIFEIHFEYPDQLSDIEADEKPCYCEIVLHCYLIGPSRHYRWKGRTMEESLKLCKKDIKEWCKEVYENE